MPRGRSKNKSAEPELLPPEENDQPKIMEVKHTEQWIEHRSVGASPDDDEIDFEEDDSSEGKRKRKPKNYREELKKKLRAHGVSAGSNLRVYIEKYLHSDSNAGGSWAETEFCTKYETTEEHLLNRDYIDVARQWKAGKYRITIREGNRILEAFDQRISAAPASGPIIQSVNPADPNSPQFIIQTNGDGQTQQIPMSIKDIMKTQREALKEQLEMAKLMREAYGFAPEQPQQQPRSEEEIIASAIIKQPAVIESVVESLVKRVGGKSGDDDGNAWANVAMEVVKTGQVGQVVKELVNGFFNGFKGLFPGGQNNEQAEMGQAGMANVPSADSQPPGQGQMQIRQNQSPEEQPQGHANLAEVDQNAGSEGLAAISAEEQALNLMLDHCRRKAPVKVACDRLIAYADLLNSQAPQFSIDAYISMFAAMPVDDALAFVKTQPNGEAVASLPHAKEWTEQLQKLIREAGQEGEE